jgi:hypothetical protein
LFLLLFIFINSNENNHQWLHSKNISSLLTDFSIHPTWNPFIKSLTGVVYVGNTITVSLEPPKASGMTFKPKVLVFEDNKKFVWLGHLFINGLFDGEHSFELIDNLDGTTTFMQSEKFE